MRALVYRCAVLAVFGLFGACTKHRSITEDVTKQIRSGATQVNIGQLGDFAWDRMFVFGPYYPKDAICRTLKVADSQCSAADIRDVDENEFLMVFLERGAVSRIESFPRTVGDFNESCLAKDIARGTATVTVARKPLVKLVCR
jgi:hypothetical protein